MARDIDSHSGQVG